MTRARGKKLTPETAPYPVPRTGDTYLVKPSTMERKTIVRVVREGTGMQARTFTVVNEDRNLAWVRWANQDVTWVDAILHVDVQGFYGERCLYAHVGEMRQTSADAVMLAPEDLAVFNARYPEEAA